MVHSAVVGRQTATLDASEMSADGEPSVDALDAIGAILLDGRLMAPNEWSTAGLTTVFRKIGPSTGSKRRTGQSKGTTERGLVNRNGQVVVRATRLSGTDYGQSMYVLRCPTCDKEHGVNGSDIFQRRCPYHQGGAPGLSY